MKHNIIFTLIFILLTQEFFSQQISEASKTRQGLDSTVFQVWENNSWKRKGKYSYKYNTNEKVISYAGYGLVEGVFTQTERGTFEYNTAGKITLDLRESISEFATNIWITDRKTIHKYDTSNRLITTEVYGQYYDQSLGITVTVGIEKTDFAYNTAGEVILYTYYDWDESTAGWIRSVKIETNTLNGLETLYASYQWDNTYSSWIGIYKTEKSQLAGTGFINNTIYSWNVNNDTWYPRLKAEYLKSSDANGVVVTLNNYKLVTGTTNLAKVSRSIFSSPVTGGTLVEKSFRFKENSSWDNASQSWLVDTNTEQAFNTNGIITGVVTKQKIVKSGGASIWVDKTVVTNTIQDEKIVESRTDNYTYNQTIESNELTSSSRDVFTYDTQGMTATRISQNYDAGIAGWVNNARMDYCYNTRLMQIGQKNYSWNINDWKLINHTENDVDQAGNILRDINIYFSEEFKQIIIGRWIQNDYDANRNLISAVNVKTTITKNAQTGKNEFETKGSKTAATFVNNQLSTLVNAVYDVSENDFNDTDKTVYEYFPEYPVALKSETIYTFDASGQNPVLKEKTELSYNFSYPQQLLMLPFHTLIKNNPILKYYRYQPVNLISRLWNAKTATWTDNEKTQMYFTSKTLTDNPVIPAAEPVLTANTQAGSISISGRRDAGFLKLILFDLTGKEVMQLYPDENGTVAYNKNVRGIHIYRLMQQNNCISKGKIIL